MTPDQNKGLWLCQEPEKTRLGWLVSTLAAAMSCVLLLLILANLTNYPGSTASMVLPGAGLCILFGFLKYLRKETLFYAGVLVTLVAMVLLTGRAIQNGMGLLWNSLAQARTAATGKMLPDVQVQAGGVATLVPVSILLGAVIALVCCGLSGRYRPVLAVALPVFLVAGMAFFRKDGTFSYILPVSALSVLLLLTADGPRKLRGRSMFWCLMITAALLLTALLLTPGVGEWAENSCRRFQKAVHSRRYETDDTTLPEGDFTAFMPEGETSHPALAVTMEVPEPLYLRGFTGVNLEGDSWKQIDSGVLAENRELLYWLNTNEFHIQTQFAAAAEALELEANPVTVRNIGACSRYRYVPFTLSPDSALEQENLSPDSLTQSGVRQDTFRVLTHGTEQLLPLLEALQREASHEILGYRQAESAYRDFVYRQYLEISPEAMEMLQPQWDQAAKKYGGVQKMDAHQAQACVLEFLARCFADASEAELPLPQASGTEYQYATVAVLTLRYFGIPARYAEGYRITEAMAAQAEPGEPIQVDSSCAGAWAEVYQDGIGWIPMELTRGMDPQGESLGDQKEENPDEVSTDLKEGQELEETPENPVQEPDPQGGSQVQLRKGIRWGFPVILMTVCLLLLLCRLRRNRILKKRMERFYLPERAAATAWIYAHTALLLEKMGYHRGNGSMEMLRDAVAGGLGEDYARRFLEMYALSERAIFSSRPMEEDRWQEMLAFYETTLQQLKERLTLFRRLWLQWILCLF